MKTLAQVKAETELARLKLTIPALNNLTKNQEDYIISCFKITYQEGELNGMIKAGEILL